MIQSFITYQLIDQKMKVKEIDTKRQDFKQKVINGVLTLSQAGYEIDEEELKELTGFSTVRKKENTTF